MHTLVCATGVRTCALKIDIICDKMNNNNKKSLQLLFEVQNIEEYENGIDANIEIRAAVIQPPAISVHLLDLF